MQAFLFVILNILMCAGIVVLMISSGHLPEMGFEWLLFLLFFVAPICNIFLFFSNKIIPESWFLLFLKRKTLEEKKKIKDLLKDINQ